MAAFELGCTTGVAVMEPRDVSEVVAGGAGMASRLNAAATQIKFF